MLVVTGVIEVGASETAAMAAFKGALGGLTVVSREIAMCVPGGPKQALA